MKELKIKIDDERIAKLVEEHIAKEIVTGSYSWEGREAKRGIRDAMDKAVQKYLYSQKDKIIEKVVERATREIVKKGIPKLLEKEL